MEQREKENGKFQKVVMNSNIEVKLGQLLEICPQLKEMIIKSLLKMEEAHIVDV
jgi:hypothetical protein